MVPRRRSEEKAEQILEAAYRCLTEQGYAATTISGVAERAGVSRGLLHYYFESKEDMLAQVVRRNAEPSIQLLGPLVLSSESPQQLAANISRAARGIMESNPALFTLVYEGWVVSRQSQVVARELRLLFQRFRGALETGLQGAISRGILAPRLGAAGLSMSIMGLLDGLGLQLLLDPELASAETTWVAIEQAVAAMLSAGEASDGTA
jgi:AcrR family transcriptional regulator